MIEFEDAAELARSGGLVSPYNNLGCSYAETGDLDISESPVVRLSIEPSRGDCERC